MEGVANQPAWQINCTRNDEVNEELVSSTAWSRNTQNCSIDMMELHVYINCHEATHT